MGRMKSTLEMPRYIVDGFVFHVNSIKGKSSVNYLRCLEYKRLGCHARATIPTNGDINEIKLKKAHNHPPDYNAEEKIIFVRELNEAMKNNKATSTRDVYNLLAPLYPNAAHELPYEKLRFKMHRWKRAFESTDN